MFLKLNNGYVTKLWALNLWGKLLYNPSYTLCYVTLENNLVFIYLILINIAS